MPTREQVRLVLERVRRGSDIAYFFGELTSAEWIGPLREEGLFDNPPGPEVEGDWVRYPEWPAARYLARVSSTAPSEVLEIIHAVPEVGNPRIHDTFVEAALAMPHEMAAQLAPDVARWLQSSKHLLLLPEHAAKLTSRLALEGATAEALVIANALLTIDPPGEFDDPHTRPSAHVGGHEFPRVLDEICGPLIETAGVSALELLTSTLATVLAYLQPKDKRPPFEDFSYIWRPVLTESERSARDPAAALTDVIVPAAERLVNSGEIPADEVLTLLGKGHWKIERRIALHLLARFPDRFDLTAAANLVINAATIRDPACEYELQAAIGALYPLLPKKGRSRYLDLVRRGPVASTAQRKRFGARWSEFVVHWQSKRLAPVFHALSDVDRVWASSVLDETIIDELLTRPRRRSASFVGPISPRTPNELAALSVGEILEFLETWVPTGDWAAPSPEGLGRALSSAVSMKPRYFASAAQDFIGYNPVYVRSVVSGLRDAVSQGARISWNPVLALCKWITMQSLEVVHADWRESDRDPGWSWTWIDVARLVSEGMVHSTSGLPRSAASQVWAVLERISRMPEHSSEFSTEARGREIDPAMLSINTGRGEALHAVVRYAWWESKGKGPIRQKVRSLLGYHADPTHEKSAAVHSVYGRWLSVLLTLDKAWTQTILPKIFPSDSNLNIYWRAAWDSFVSFDQPTRSTFESIEGEYRRAIREIFIESNDQHKIDRIHATAQHVVIYYLWELFVLTDSESLLRTFLNNASDEARAELIAFTGRLLRDEEKSNRPSARQVELLKLLWLDRRESAERGDDDMARELAAFAWWCGTSSLEPEWWLPQLQWITSNSIEPDPIFLVLDALPSAASVDPVTTVRILRRLLDIAKSPWTFSGHVDEIRNTLSIAMSSSDETAKEGGRQLINKLGALEIADLRDLLQHEF